MNTKKILVNSQVRAMITILESTCIVLFAVVKNFIQEKPVLMRLIQCIGMFCVISPYAFLMNTPYNKTRIVECGWKNVIKNLIGCSNNSLVESFNGTEGKSSVPPRKKGISKLAKSQRQANVPTDKDIYIISKVFNKSTINLQLNETNDDPALHTPLYREPSTSYGSTSGVLERVSSYSNDENDPVKEGKIPYIALTQIGILIDNLEDERLYLKCFRNLIDIQNERKYEENELTSKSKSYSNKRQNNECYQTNRTVNTKDTIMLSVKGISHKRSWDPTKESLDEESDYIFPKLKGESSERYILRKKLLNQFFSCYDNHERFNALFERLIDMEEGFVM